MQTIMMAFKNFNCAQNTASALLGSASALGVAIISAASLGQAVFSLAQAQDVASTVSLYARLSAGAAFVSDLDQDISYNPDLAFVITPPDELQVSYDTGLTLGGAVGFDYGNNFRTELEYRYIEADQDQAEFRNSFAPGGGLLAVDGAGDADGQLVAHALLANVAYDFAVDGPVTPFVSVGFGGARVRNDSVGPFSGGDETALTYAYQARAGVSYDVSDDLSLGVDYAYFATGELTFGPEEFEVGSTAPDPRLDDDNLSVSTVQFFVQKSF